MLIFNEAFMMGYMYLTVGAMVVGFIATEVKLSRVNKDWDYQ